MPDSADGLMQGMADTSLPFRSEAETSGFDGTAPEPEPSPEPMIYDGSGDLDPEDEMSTTNGADPVDGPAGPGPAPDPTIELVIRESDGTLPENLTVTPAHSANGNIIVGDKSKPNQTPWWVKSHFKPNDEGSSRDIELDHGAIGDLAVIGLSMRGTKHQYYGGPNQDSFHIVTTDDWLIAAVADGVSNSEHSAFGARYIAQAVTRSIKAALGQIRSPNSQQLRLAIEDAVEDNCRTMVWRPNEIGAPTVGPDEIDPELIPAQLATTLTIVAIATSARADERVAHVLAVGDSPVYTLSDGAWCLRSPHAKDGDLMDLSTQSVPALGGQAIASDWFEFAVRSGDLVALVTDGIGNALGDGQNDVGDWLKGSLSRPCNLDQALTTLRYDRRGEDDDRTAVLIWVLEPESEGSVA